MSVIVRTEGEGRPEGFFQRRFVEGFIEECDSPGLPPARFSLAISMRRDENDRQARALGHKSFLKLQSAHPRKPHVEDQTSLKRRRPGAQELIGRRERLCVPSP